MGISMSLFLICFLCCKQLLDSGDAAGESVAVPLMTLIDYRGYRLVAMSLLPVSKETLCYGYVALGLCACKKYALTIFLSSCDGGVTVHADYSAFNSKF